MAVNTGFVDLDHRLDGGFQKGLVYVLAGRPSMGKTSLAVNMIDFICFEKYRTVAYFSLDKPKRQMMDFFLAIKAGIDPWKIRTGELDGKDWHKIAMAAEMIGKSNLIIDDTECDTVQDIRSKCIRYRRQSDDLAVIFIDYFQLMSDSESSGSRKEELLRIIKDTKKLARELDRPIVILSQISRRPEYRADHRPILKDFREGRAISQWADVVMFLYRDEYYNPDSKEKGIAEVFVAKNSMGSIGPTRLGYQESVLRFENIRACK